MDKEMEKGKSIAIIVIYYVMDNIYMAKNGMELKRNMKKIKKMKK